MTGKEWVSHGVQRSVLTPVWHVSTSFWYFNFLFWLFLVETPLSWQESLLVLVSLSKLDYLALHVSTVTSSRRALRSRVCITQLGTLACSLWYETNIHLIISLHGTANHSALDIITWQYVASQYISGYCFTLHNMLNHIMSFDVMSSMFSYTGEVPLAAVLHDARGGHKGALHESACMACLEVWSLSNQLAVGPRIFTYFFSMAKQLHQGGCCQLGIHCWPTEVEVDLIKFGIGSRMWRRQQTQTPRWNPRTRIDLYCGRFPVSLHCTIVRSELV